MLCIWFICSANLVPTKIADSYFECEHVCREPLLRPGPLIAATSKPCSSGISASIPPSPFEPEQFQCQSTAAIFWHQPHQLIIVNGTSHWDPLRLRSKFFQSVGLRSLPEITNESQKRDANSKVRIQIDIMILWLVSQIFKTNYAIHAKIQRSNLQQRNSWPCCITSRCSAMILEFFWASLFQVCNSSWSSSSSWTVTRMHQDDWIILNPSTCVKSVSFIYVVSDSAPTIDVTPKSCSSGTSASVLPTHLRPGQRDESTMLWLSWLTAMPMGRSENSGWSHPSTQGHYNLWPNLESLVLKHNQTYSPSSELIQTPSCSSLCFSGHSCSSSLLFWLLQFQSTLLKLLSGQWQTENHGTCCGEVSTPTYFANVIENHWKGLELAMSFYDHFWHLGTSDD